MDEGRFLNDYAKIRREIKGLLEGVFGGSSGRSICVGGPEKCAEESCPRWCLRAQVIGSRPFTRGSDWNGQG